MCGRQSQTCAKAKWRIGTGSKKQVAHWQAVRIGWLPPSYWCLATYPSQRVLERYLQLRVAGCKVHELRSIEGDGGIGGRRHGLHVRSTQCVDCSWSCRSRVKGPRTLSRKLTVSLASLTATNWHSRSTNNPGS